MAVKVKPIAEVAAKWAEVTPARSSYYEKGAVGAGADWEKGATGAAAAFASAVSAGNIKQMYAGGVRKAGAAKYDRKVKDVGVGRFGAGVTAAVGDYSSGVDPYLSTIAGLTLTTRAPRGSAVNLQRVAEIATALTKKRLALRAAGA